MHSTTDDVNNSFSSDKNPVQQDENLAKVTKAVPKRIDFAKLSRYFGYRPIDVIRQTLRNATQLATSVNHYPMRRHLRSRFEMLQCCRQNEVIATDTYFSKVKSIEGYWCSQVFYGTKLHSIHVAGVKTESEFADVYMDYIRQVGIPPVLHRDNAKSEISKKVLHIH